MSKNLNFHEIGKMLNTNNRQILNFLLEKKILFKSRKKNLPMDDYLAKGWFEVGEFPIDKGHYTFVVPVVEVTQKGYENIKRLWYEKHDSFVRQVVPDRVKAELGKLGIKYERKNILTRKDRQNTGKVDIYCYNNDFIYLLSYNEKENKFL